MNSLKNNLRIRTTQEEGIRLKPYKCTNDKLTIGIGRNLESVGLRIDEVHYLHDNDLDEAIKHCQELSYFDTLDEVRQEIIADMMFNMGPLIFSGFVRFSRAMKIHDYDAAAYEMQNSTWFKQVPNRARPLIAAMKSGKF